MWPYIFLARQRGSHGTDAEVCVSVGWLVSFFFFFFKEDCGRGESLYRHLFMCINPCILYIIAVRMAAINTPPLPPPLSWFYSTLSWPPISLDTYNIRPFFPIYPLQIFQKAIIQPALQRIPNWRGMSVFIMSRSSSLIFPDPQQKKTKFNRYIVLPPFFFLLRNCVASCNNSNGSYRIIKRWRKVQEEINKNADVPQRLIRIIHEA